MKVAFGILAMAVAALASAQAQDPATGPNPAAQAAADIIAKSANVEIAFLPAGSLKAATASLDLAGIIQFPADEIVVVKLKGSEISDALERSVANIPDSNSAFLQLSGLLVTYSTSAAPGSRILEVKVGDNALQPGKDYEIAMPASLARGALGYFKIWDKNKIVRQTGTSLGDALKGKTGSASKPRYVPRSA